MSAHGIEVCACGAVIAQCRCPGPHTPRVVRETCSECRGKAKLPRDLATIEALREERAGLLAAIANLTARVAKLEATSVVAWVGPIATPLPAGVTVETIPQKIDLPGRTGVAPLTCDGSGTGVQPLTIGLPEVR